MADPEPEINEICEDGDDEVESEDLCLTNDSTEHVTNILRNLATHGELTNLQPNHTVTENTPCDEEEGDGICEINEAEDDVLAVVSELRTDMLHILQLMDKLNREVCSHKKILGTLLKRSKCSTDLGSCASEGGLNEYTRLQGEMEDKMDIMKVEMEDKLKEMISSAISLNRTRINSHRVNNNLAASNRSKGSNNTVSQARVGNRMAYLQ
jgi:hypothetical protein